MYYYTGVGSRETPPEILEILRQTAKRLGKAGYTLRSGGADGADDAFEQGASFSGFSRNIYLPWNGFNGRPTDGKIYINAECSPLFQQAVKIAEEIHPAWDKCSNGARQLHTRNVFQVLGDDLQTPSKFLICWAIPAGKNGNVKGGTNTAVKLAQEYSVPVRNLYLPEWLDKTREWLNDSKVD